MKNQYIARLSEDWKSRILSGNDNSVTFTMADMHAQMFDHYRELFEAHQKPICRTSMASCFTPLGVSGRLQLEIRRFLNKLRNARFFPVRENLLETKVRPAG